MQTWAVDCANNRCGNLLLRAAPLVSSGRTGLRRHVFRHGRGGGTEIKHATLRTCLTVSVASLRLFATEVARGWGSVPLRRSPTTVCRSRRPRDLLLRGLGSRRKARPVGELENADFYHNISTRSGEWLFENGGRVGTGILGGYSTCPVPFDRERNRVPDRFAGTEDGYYHYLLNPRTGDN